ncbi:hypothetical protein Glaag_1248 [Glaciecola sp. 4H-3-7+YE-5]|nr:hypothetical protein Glaag_1248 [Glaciecola sp. 4H-3-7+YE-5]
MLSTTTSATLIFIRLFLKKISARVEYIKQRNRNLLAREVLIKKGDAKKIEKRQELGGEIKKAGPNDPTKLLTLGERAKKFLSDWQIRE